MKKLLFRNKSKKFLKEIINGKWYGMAKRIFVLLSFFLMLLLLYAVVYLNGGTFTSFLTNAEILEKTCFTMQIAGFFFATIGVIAAVLQYILATKQEFKSFHNNAVQKAIDLSGYYKDNIISLYVIIRDIIEETKISDIIDSVDYNKMKEFDEIELNDIFGANQIQSIKECLDSDDYIKIVKKVCKNRGFEIGVTIPSNLPEDDEREFYSLFATNLIHNILNNMEYFAMYFTHKCADDTVVYQSLHQTYLTTVRLLYYNIAINNGQGADKFYTNVIELYNIWNERYFSRKEKFALGIRELVEKGNSADHA